MFCEKSNLPKNIRPSGGWFAQDSTHYRPAKQVNTIDTIYTMRDSTVITYPIVVPILHMRGIIAKASPILVGSFSWGRGSISNQKNILVHSTSTMTVFETPAEF
jgi:hypothetical protein